MSIILNDDELAALRDASPAFMRLYVLGLRPMMDFRTGLCGERYGVAYSRLGLEVSYSPPPGSRRPAWRPSRDNVISLFDEGRRLGMIRMCSPDRARQLVFELVLADRGSSVSQRTPTGSPHHDTHSDDDMESNGNHGVGGGLHDDDAHGSAAEDAPISVSRGVGVGNSSGGGKGRSTRTTPKPTTTSDLPVPVAERAAALCQTLRQFRFVCDPVQFRTVEYREMLEQFSDDEIQRAAESVSLRPGLRPGQTFNLAYLLRVVGDLAVSRAAPAAHSRRGSAGSGMQQPWYLVAREVELRGAEMGIVWDSVEYWPAYRDRVIAAAGVSSDEFSRAYVDFVR